MRIVHPRRRRRRSADHHSLRHRSLQADLCPMDAKECADGSFANRDPNMDCEFEPCPEDLLGACTMDVKECDDGSFVSRDADIGCDFLPCPEEQIACAMDVQECDDGTFVSRDPTKNCAFKACPKVCTGEDGETYMAPCEGMDGMFCIGEKYIATDGCNNCSCGNMDGLAKCTMMACPPVPDENQTVGVKGDEAATTCLVNGLEIEVGQEYTAPDGCNVSR